MMEENKIIEMWQEYVSLLRSTNRDGIENLIKWLDESDFKYAPASTVYHGAFRGGLLKHSLGVYYALKDFQHLIDFFELEEETLILTALLHDICKVNCYVESTKNVKNENGDWVKVPYYMWDEQEPLGHSEKSIMLIYENGVQLSKVERAMIRNHMGFTGNDDERRVSKLFRICPQSLLLHWADAEATFVFESEDMPERFRSKITGRNIMDCIKHQESKSDEVIVDGTSYKLAPANSVVDNEKIILISYNNTPIKVYSPYGDGLPF